jgi:hypothetical protein
MTVHSEAEAVRQAKEYLDIGFVVNAIKRPDGSIAHDQDQLGACPSYPLFKAQRV